MANSHSSLKYAQSKRKNRELSERPKDGKLTSLVFHLRFQSPLFLLGQLDVATVSYKLLLFETGLLFGFSGQTAFLLFRLLLALHRRHDFNLRRRSLFRFFRFPGLSPSRDQSLRSRCPNASWLRTRSTLGLGSRARGILLFYVLFGKKHFAQRVKFGRTPFFFCGKRHP